MIGKRQANTSLALRLASLLGGVSIFILRHELDSGAILVLLFVVFHVGPYLIAALLPMKWETAQVGFITGLSISTFLGLFLLMLANAMGFPDSPRSPSWAYPFAFASDSVLFAIVVTSWVLRREEIRKRIVVRFLLLGLAYPFLAFALGAVTAVLVGNNFAMR